MRINQLLFSSLLLMIFCACSNGVNNEGMKRSFADEATGNMEEYVNGDVNAIVQALPKIIVIPSDQVLDNCYCLSEKKLDGKTYKIRNFQDYFLNDSKAKPIISFIQEKFNEGGYPLNDLEQSLKAIDTQEAIDMASGLAIDAKTTLLTTVHPDIILELYYKVSRSSQNSNKQKVSYIITALDAYTQKNVATIESQNAEGDDAIETLQAQISESLPKLMTDIQSYFADILTRGRDVNITINVAEGSNQNLQDQSIEGDSYTDQIISYIKKTTIKGAYSLQVNTKNKLVINNVRIKLLNDDGTQYGVYDYARDLQQYLKKNLGLSTTNNSQGLGNIVLTIEGI